MVTSSSHALKRLAFEAHRIASGERLFLQPSDMERAIILLSGRCDLQAGRQVFREVESRDDVFSEAGPYVILLRDGEEIEVQAKNDVQVAVVETRRTEAGPPIFIKPSSMKLEDRGTGERARRVRHLLSPSVHTGFILFEVYTPGGHWSSFPPHRHDRVDGQEENLLEEVYYYQFKPSSGFALQRNFDDEVGLDELFVARSGTIVPVQLGYHTVAVAPGSECYYLNVMAGESTDWLFRFHPDYRQFQDYGLRP